MLYKIIDIILKQLTNYINYILQKYTNRVNDETRARRGERNYLRRNCTRLIWRDKGVQGRRELIANVALNRGDIVTKG